MENKELTQQQLESHLWGACDILRGSIDSGDYKHYIFGLLFFKRLSDVWQEEYKARLDEFDDEELAKDPEEHRFHIPEGSFWKDVKGKSKNIGASLNAAFRAIEDANLKLKDVFQDVDFNNKRRFPDATLEKLLQHFDRYSLKKADVSADMLGNAYEYLIAKFADDAGAKGGEFYTPKEVVRLIVELLKPEDGQSIYDPTCGSGGMLLESFHHLQRNKKNAKSLRLFGQEKNLNTWAISQMNLFLHDIDDAKVFHGDTLADPKHLENEEGKRIKQFDIVIANPPFSLKSWGFETWKNGDPFHRDEFGCPPKGYGDLAFVQHMIRSMNSKGKVGVVVPHGVLFRGGAEGKIRKAIIEHESDMLEAVIGIPSGLFYGTGIPASVLIFNKNKAKERKDKVIFINAELLYKEGKNQNKLTKNDIKDIVEAFDTYENKKRFCQIVSREELKENDYNLNIRRYADTSPPPENYDVRAILHGGIPKYEVENEYIHEVLDGFDVSLVFDEKDKDYYQFKTSIKSKEQIREVCGDVDQKVVAQVEKWWNKYNTSLLQVESRCLDAETSLKKFLAELGYE